MLKNRCIIISCSWDIGVSNHELTIRSVDREHMEKLLDKCKLLGIKHYCRGYTDYIETQRVVRALEGIETCVNGLHTGNEILMYFTDRKTLGIYTSIEHVLFGFRFSDAEYSVGSFVDMVGAFGSEFQSCLLRSSIPGGEGIETQRLLNKPGEILLDNEDELYGHITVYGTENVYGCIINECNNIESAKIHFGIELMGSRKPIIKNCNNLKELVLWGKPSVLAVLSPFSIIENCKSIEKVVLVATKPKGVIYDNFSFDKSIIKAKEVLIKSFGTGVDVVTETYLT